MINALREHDGRQQLTLEEAVATGELEYIAFPEALKGKYQAFTQANLENLRKAGCDVEFRTVQEAPASTCRTSSPPSRTWKNDDKGRISRP